MSNPIDNKNILQLLFSALESAANGIVITDQHGRIIWVNPAMNSLTGYSTEEILGKNPRLFKSNHHSEEFYKNLWQTINNGEVWRGEIINRRKDGSLYHEDITITPVLSEGGEITNYIAIKQDITPLRQAVEALTESKERFRQLINAVNAHFYAAEYTPKGGARHNMSLKISKPCSTTRAANFSRILASGTALSTRTINTYQKQILTN